MSISTSRKAIVRTKKTTRQAVADIRATGARVTDTMLYVTLSDSREVGLPLSLPGLRWLASATPAQRARWTIEPHGLAVLWDELDEGVEVEHLLSAEPLG
jgi:hypothetical protein